MKIIPVFLSVWLLLSGQSVAQQADTLASETLPEVTVFGQKYERFAAGSRITSIDSADLRRAGQRTLADVLQWQTPLYVKSYGPGALSSVSFRGTSAAQTAVLWNGFNINLPTAGESDFALLPVAAGDQVTVQHGSSSAGYGTGAIGGAILLDSPVQWKKSYSATIRQEAGSFGYWHSTAQGAFSNERISVQARAYRTQAENNFPYENTLRFNSPRERQANAALRQYGATTDVGIRLGKHVQWITRGWFARSDREIPPAMASANTHARQADRNIRLLSELHTSHGAGNTAIRIAYFDDLLKYRDDHISQSNSSVQTIQGQAEHERTIGKNVTLKAGAEFQHFIAEVDGYGSKQTENRASFFLLTRYHPLPRVDVSLNLRQAIVAGFNPPFTPSVGIHYLAVRSPEHALTLKVSASAGYRVSTLNERYWQPGGNPDIKPENSRNYEVGVRHEFKRRKLKMQTEITGFTMRVRDWIQWQPGAQGYWSPTNLMRVHARGAEATVKTNYQLTRKMYLTTSGSYAFTRSTQEETYGRMNEQLGKQLMYVPLHTATGQAGLNLNSWQLHAQIRYTGERFTYGNSRKLELFTIVNLQLTKVFTINNVSGSVFTSVNNLLHVAYQNLEARAMPGRSFTMGLQIAIKQ